MRISFKTFPCLTGAFLCVMMTAWLHADAATRIQPYSENPRYWQYRGKPVLLLGGTKDDNLFQVSDLKEHLDLLAACGGNYIRNTMSARDNGNVQPFPRLDSGKYDLRRWNPEYWQRLERMLRLTHEKEIFVQVEIWAFHDFNRQTWLENPWRPGNNVNYTQDETTLRNTSVNLGSSKQEFFFTVPAVNDDPVVLQHQQRFVDRILEHTLEYDHVLYCITNEIHPQFPPQWGWYWAEYIRAKASQAGKTIEVTEMLWEPDMQSEQQKASLDHPEIYSYFECSQNSANSGQENGDYMQYVYSQLEDHPRPINHVKIYGADTGPSWAGDSINAERRFWRNIIGGSASSRFHRPPTGIGLSDEAQAHIRSMRLLTSELDLFTCRSDINDRLLNDRAPDEAYLIYEEGTQYAVFFPAGGAVGLDLKAVAGPFRLKWLDIRRSTWAGVSTIEGDRVIQLKTPDAGSWLVFAQKVSRDQRASD